MILFEKLKLFPKVDLHIDYFGSIPKEAIYELVKSKNNNDIDEILEINSQADYDNTKEFIKKILNNYEAINLATKNLLEKLKQLNLLYGEIYLNLDGFINKLDKNIIIKNILKLIKESKLNINIILEIEMNITKEALYDDINILYKYYQKGVTGVYIKKNKLDSIDSYQSLFNKFIKDNINYIVLMNSKLTNQNKDIFYNASRIIYNILEYDNNFFEIIKEKKIMLEEAITYQHYFNLYDELKNHFVYDLYKDNINICFTTCDMTILDTDLLNEYCCLFNVFPFNLHDLVNINLNILNNINVSLELKNNLISEFKEKVNDLL